MLIDLEQLEQDIATVARNGFAQQLGPIALGSLEFLRPPQNISTTDAAETSRYIRTADGGKRLWSRALTPYMVGPQDAMDDPDIAVVLIPGSARSGKALALDTPIPTPSGWTAMGDLTEGDMIFDEAGRPCRVTLATPVMFDRDCFRVRFCDGSEIVADAEHLWEVLYSPSGGPSGEKKLVLQTTDLLPRLHRRNGKGNCLSIPLAPALNCPSVDLPIDPYVFGVWLGDGQSIGCAIYVHERDIEIVEEVARRGYRAARRHRTDTGLLTFGLYLATDDPNFCSRGHDYRIAGRYRWGSCRACGRMDALHRKDGRPRDEPKPRDTFSQRLRDMGVFGAKRIPVAYLRSSAEQRADLLKGLMDTDGFIDARTGRSVFTTTSADLARDFLELARSLGLKPAVTRSPAYAVVDGKRRQGADAYDIGFMAYSEQPVFALRRKFERQRPIAGGKPGHVKRRRIVAIDPVPSVPVRCIQVDSPSHLFLAGDAMVPTHNTIGFENHLHKRLRFGPHTDAILYLPGDTDVENYADKDFATYFELHPEIAAKIGAKPSDNKRTTKRIDGKFINLLPANDRTIRGRQAPLIGADEIDGWRPKLRSNFLQQMRIRGRAYGRGFKGYACSHPDAGKGDGITAAWLESSRGEWYWPCPHCGGWSSPSPFADWRTKLDYVRDRSLPKDRMLEKVAETAGLLCPHCGTLIGNEHKVDMNAAGKWVFHGQTITVDGQVDGDPFKTDTAGFWIHGTMSPFVSWGELAKEYVAALVFFEDTGKADRVREVTAKSLGEPYEGPTGKRVNAKILAARAKERDDGRVYQKGRVPPWVRYITASADTAGNGWDVGIIGWGEAWESCLIDRFKLVAGPGGEKLSPGTRLADWDVLGEVLWRSYPLAKDVRLHMPIATLVVDGHGVPGAVWNARRWAKTLTERNVPAYKLRLIKGDGRPTHPEVGLPRSIDRDDEGKPLEPPVYEIPLGVHKLKETVLERLAIDAPGPGFMHFYEDCDPAVFEELLAEPLIDGKFVRQGPNETLDLWGYGTAGAVMLKPDRPEINWLKPPPWARPFEKQTVVKKQDAPAKSGRELLLEKMRR